MFNSLAGLASQPPAGGRNHLASLMPQNDPSQAVLAMFRDNGLPEPDPGTMQKIKDGFVQLQAQGTSPDQAMKQLEAAILHHKPKAQMAQAGEVPPNPRMSQQEYDQQGRAEAAERRFNQAPTDMNGMLMDQARGLSAPQEMMRPQQPRVAGGRDPGEEASYQRAQRAKQAFDASPTKQNRDALDQSMTDYIDQYFDDTDPEGIRRTNEVNGMLDSGAESAPFADVPMSNLRRSGTGKTLASLPSAGPQVAEADTGAKSDASGMKLTEQQSKDLGFFDRMDGAEGKISEFGNALMDRGDQFLNAIPVFGNSFVPEEYQRARNAGGEWIVGLLRKDTGAQVTKEEWALYGPIYLPQPGDKPGTLADKVERRKRAAVDIKKGLGTAEVLANELQFERQNKPADPAAGDDGGDWRSKDPSTWTDEQLQEYLK